MKSSVFRFSLLFFYYLLIILRQEMLVDIFLVVDKYYLLYTPLPSWEKLLR